MQSLPEPQSQGDTKAWWGLWQTNACVPFQKRIAAAQCEGTVATWACRTLDILSQARGLFSFNMISYNSNSEKLKTVQAK